MKEQFVTQLGVKDDAAELLIESLLRMSGFDREDLDSDAEIKIVEIDDLTKFRTACGSGERYIDTNAVGVLKKAGAAKVAVIVTQPQGEVCAMVAPVPKRVAERFSNKLEDASLREDTTPVRGWASFESE